MAAAVGVHRGVRWVATYLAILGVGAAVLLIVLPIGDDITPAPQAPALGAVSGDAKACLGDRLASVQSGEFVEFHIPGRPGATAGEELGPKVADGRIDRTTGRGTLGGTCAEGTEQAGQSLTFAAHFVATATEGDGDVPAVVQGTVTVGANDYTARITAVDTQGSAGPEPTLDPSELIARIFLAVAVVIVASRAVGFVFSLVRQPRVVGEILAGILLGPSLLGAVFPEASRYLFPPEVTSVLHVLAEFGLIFFMFLIGLELDHKLIRGSGHTAVLVSHVSIVLPFTLGVVSALWLYPLLGSGRFTGFALFMGAAMAVTAFPVLARILTDTGLHRTRLGALSITCAAVDDVTAWCMLAVVVAVANSSDPREAFDTIALSLLFVIAMLMVVRPIVARLAVAHQARGKLNPPIMAGIIVGVLMSAWCTEQIGIHAIFGAFMAGAILPRRPALVREITERLEDVTVLLLLPIFFAVVGLSTRIGLIGDAELWIVAAAMFALAVLGKWGGSMIAARAAGQSWRYSTALGVLMNTRGLTGTVILTIGQSLGVISPALFTIMVLIALATTVMAMPIITALYPRRLIDREAARAAAVERVGRGVGDQHRVLIGIGNVANAHAMVDLVTDLRSVDGTAPAVILAHVVPLPGREEIRASLSVIERAERDAVDELSPVRLRLVEAGVEPEVATAVGDDPAAEVARLARQHHADTVVLAAHRAYLGRNPLGGVVGQILGDPPSEVWVVVQPEADQNGELDTAESDRQAAAPASGPIGVWFRGLLQDAAAVDLAASLARGRNESLRVVHPAGVRLPAVVATVEDVPLEQPDGTTALAAMAGCSVVVVARVQVADGALPQLREALISGAQVPVLVVQQGPPADSREATNGRDVAAELVSGTAPAGSTH